MKFTLLSLFLILGISSARAAAPSILINDTFPGAKNASLQDHGPDKADVTGGKWSVCGFDSGGGFMAVTTGDNTADLICGGNSNGAIAIFVLGGAVPDAPLRFNIACDLRGAEAGLGFYSGFVRQDKFSSYDAFTNFTGLRLRGDGTLALYHNGGFVSAVKYTGAFDPTQFHRLSYDVDSFSGAISNVSLQGSTSDYSSFTAPGFFTAQAIAYAAVAALCEGGRDNQVYARNFVVSQLLDAGSGTPPASKQPAESSSPILIKSGDKIGFLGDSITAQGNAPKGYVQLVIAGLKAEGIDTTAVPAGHTGDTSGNMLTRINIDVFHLGATWMTLSCGVNDVHLTPGVSLDDYKANVETMVARAEAWNVRVVILTATPAGEDANSPLNQKLAPYNEFLRSFAAQKQLPLADINAAFWKVLNTPAPAGTPPGKRLLADGIHPNEAGQFIMATTLLRTLGVPEADMPKVETALHASAGK